MSEFVLRKCKELVDELRDLGFGYSFVADLDSSMCAYYSKELFVHFSRYGLSFKGGLWFYTVIRTVGYQCLVISFVDRELYAEFLIRYSELVQYGV